MTRRRVQIEKNLFFEYEVSPHRAILERISSTTGRLAGSTTASEKSKEVLGSITREGSLRGSSETGMHVPFKQIRSKGSINPLKPPLHVETVLIGRALEQETGYLNGVGFRIRDDGYVEGEFLNGVEKFDSFEEFTKAVKCRLQKFEDNDDRE
ncbi:hypothetical protein [Bradyrhizobium sp. B120]|uniref:hypothetical protein n=1 Tax=Bradyrhizobium sp. B120 TaxID=3410088 RepID=UPI003B97EF7D